MKIYIICPVTILTAVQKELLLFYTNGLEEQGHEVHLPFRNTDQKMPVQSIMQANRAAIQNADEIHVAWVKESTGSHLDLGIAYALHKKLVQIPSFEIVPTEHKSVDNFLIYLLDKWSKYA